MFGKNEPSDLQGAIAWLEEILDLIATLKAAHPTPANIAAVRFHTASFFDIADHYGLPLEVTQAIFSGHKIH